MPNRFPIASNLRLVVPVVLFAFAVGGCASATHVAFVRDQSPITATTVKILVPQEEVYAKVNQSKVSMATGGGLLFALVDTAITNSRSKTAEKRIAPLRQVLSDLDVRHQLTERLEPAFRDTSWLHIQGVTTSQERIPPSQRDEIARSLRTDALLLIETDYALSPDFRVLGVTTSAELRTAKSNNAVYLARFISVSDPVIADSLDADSPDAAVAAWAAEGGAAFRRMINQALDETVMMLQLDLLDPNAAEKATGTVVSLTYQNPVTGTSAEIEGPVLYRRGTRAIVRAEDGNLVALANDGAAETH